MLGKAGCRCAAQQATGHAVPHAKRGALEDRYGMQSITHICSLGLARRIPFDTCEWLSATQWLSTAYNPFLATIGYRTELSSR